MKPAPTVLDVLLRARELPWCRGTLARDRDGVKIDLRSRRAAAFCLAGGVERAGIELGATAGLTQKAKALLRAALPRGSSVLSVFNDAKNRRESAIRAVQDRAIEVARQEACQ